VLGFEFSGKVTVQPFGIQTIIAWRLYGKAFCFPEEYLYYMENLFKKILLLLSFSLDMTK
jgi:hypothetical protein